MDGWQIHLRRQGFADSVGMHDVAVQRVAAGRHVGQRLPERAAAARFGVQVPDAIHLREVNHVEVHQVIVIGQQVVRAAVQPSGVAQFQH